MNPGPGMMISLDGRTTIAKRGNPFCGHCSAPYVMRDGRPIGVYIDDTTPNRRHWVMTALEHHPPPGIVFIGIGPGEHRGSGGTLDHPVIGIPRGIPSWHLLWLHEWIGWGMRYDWHDFSVPTIGHGNGYIQQWGWKGYYGRKPPSKQCLNSVSARMRKHHPRFTFKLLGSGVA